jgi:hypothetical protein
LSARFLIDKRVRGELAMGLLFRLLTTIDRDHGERLEKGGFGLLYHHRLATNIYAELVSGSGHICAGAKQCCTVKVWEFGPRRTLSSLSIGSCFVASSQNDVDVVLEFYADSSAVGGRATEGERYIN